MTKSYIKLNEILMSDNPCENILKNKEFIYKIIPELKYSEDFDQHNVHHNSDVLNHILRVVNNTPQNETLRLAALFHDIGKPFCYTLDDNGVGHFPKHEIASDEIFLNFADKNELSPELIESVSKLILYHERKLGTKPRSFNKFYLNFGTDIKELEMLFILKKADILGQNPNLAADRLKSLQIIENKYKTYLTKYIYTEMNGKLVNYEDLIDAGYDTSDVAKLIYKELYNRYGNLYLKGDSKKL